MRVKFTKCQAHVIFFDVEVGWKKRLDKIHISMRNGVTVKITQTFISDSQPFFFKYIHLYRQHMIIPSLHTNLWTMDTETYKYLKNETFSKWNENIKTCFFSAVSRFSAKIFRSGHPLAVTSYRKQSLQCQWVPRASLSEAKSACGSSQVPDFDMLEHIWHPFRFRGWENSQADPTCM